MCKKYFNTFFGSVYRFIEIILTEIIHPIASAVIHNEEETINRTRSHGKFLAVVHILTSKSSKNIRKNIKACEHHNK